MVKEITGNVQYIGVQDAELKKFDVIYDTFYGTTYNAYLVKGEEKTAIIDTVKYEFVEEYMANIREACPTMKIDYIIVNHVEPDHSGSLETLLKAAPQAQIFCSKVAAGFINEILNRPLEVHVVGSGDSLDLGGRTLHFINAPFLHWPETMFTYLKEEKVLFPCDFFGSHYGEETVTYRISDEKLIENAKFYYDCIMKPFKKFALEALDRIEGLDVEIVCPSHGPVQWVDFDVLKARYRKWSTDEKQDKHIIVGYLSCYGYTKTMAEEVARGIEASGIRAELVDLAEIDKWEIVERIEQADGLAVGSATINRDILHHFFDVFALLSTYIVRDKPAVTFGSYGWSGEAPRFMQERLVQLGYKVVGTYKARLKPSEAEKAESFKLGSLLANSL